MKKRRFNWLDAFCILLALLVLAGGLWYVLSNCSMLPKELEPKEYEIALRFSRTTTDPYDYYAVGDTMYFTGGEKKLGTITSLEIVDLMHEVYVAETGEYVLYADPQEKQIVMKVRAMGSVNRERNWFLVNEEALSVGMTFYPQSEETRSTMTIISIEEVAA